MNKKEEAKWKGGASRRLQRTCVCQEAGLLVLVEAGSLGDMQAAAQVPRKIQYSSWRPVSVENSGFSAPGQCLCDL